MFECVDVEKNVVEAAAKRDEHQNWWKSLVSSTSSTTKHEEEIPEAAPLVFPELDNMVPEKENAVKQFGRFRAGHYNRQGQAKSDAAHPNSKFDGLPKEFAGRHVNPTSDAR